MPDPRAYGEAMVPLAPTSTLFEALPPDFWGAVVPNYIAAAGGLAGTVLAILSLIYANGSKADASEALNSANSAREEASDTRAAAAAGLEIVSQTDGAGMTDGEPSRAVRTRSPEDQATLDDVIDYLQGGQSDPTDRARWLAWRSRARKR